MEMLVSLHALKLLNSIEETYLRIMCATFNGKPHTIIIFCNNPTNARNEIDITTFYDRLFYLVQHILKHNMLIIGRDMNAQISKDENYKFDLYIQPNRNGKYLTDLLLKNSLSCLNSKFQKKVGKLWNYTNPNSSKAPLDYIIINKNG